MLKIHYIDLRDILTQFARFMAVGAVGTVVHYTILILLVEKMEVSAVLGSSVGAIAGAFVNYFLNYYYTFRSNRRHAKAIVQFYIVAGSGFLLNALSMWIMVDVLDIYYLLGQLVTTGIVLLWNFWLNRIWTFRSRSLEAESSKKFSG